MKKSDKCLFCAVVKNNDPFHEIIWQNDNYMALFDAHPITLGHTLVIPKAHHDNVLDYNKGSYLELMSHAMMVAQKLKLAAKAARVGFMIEGFSVPHLHVHLIPVNKHGEIAEFKHKKIGQKKIANFAVAVRKKLNKKAK